MPGSKGTQIITGRQRSQSSGQLLPLLLSVRGSRSSWGDPLTTPEQRKQAQPSPETVGAFALPVFVIMHNRVIAILLFSLCSLHNPAGRKRDLHRV